MMKISHLFSTTLLIALLLSGYTAVPHASAQGSGSSESCAIIHSPIINGVLFQPYGATVDYYNWGELQERWVVEQGNTSVWYYITPDGNLYKWRGGGPGELAGKLVATFPLEFHEDISLFAEWDGTQCDGVDAEQVAHLSLHVAPLPPLNSTVVNADDIALLRFTAHADGDTDVVLNALVFDAEHGALSNIQNFSLWVDADNNGEAETALQQDGTLNNDSVVFDAINNAGFTVQKGSTIMFEVRGDVASTLQDDSRLQAQFAVTTAAYISAQSAHDGSVLEGIETDGTCAKNTCAISVETQPSTAWTFFSRGDLRISSSAQSTALQLLGGTESDAVFSIDLSAEKESIRITQLRIDASSVPQSVKVLALYLDDSETPFAYANSRNCEQNTVAFCANVEQQNIVVPKGETVTLRVHVVLHTDSRGAISGETFTLSFSDEDSSIVAQGVQSTSMLTENEVFIEAGISSATLETTLAKIVSMQNASTDTDGTPVPTGIADVGTFTISAADNFNTKDGTNDVVIDGIVLSLDVKDVAIQADSLQLINKGNTSLSATCTPYDETNFAQITDVITDSVQVLCNNLSASNVDTVIDSGDSQTFVLRMEITDTNTTEAEDGTSSLQVRLENYSDNSATTFGVEQHQSHLQWIDTDIGARTTFLWVDLPESTIALTHYYSRN